MAFFAAKKGVYYGKEKHIHADQTNLFPAGLHVSPHDAVYADPVTLQYR